MSIGKSVACACGCGESFKPHLDHGKQVRFIRGHHTRTAEVRAALRISGRVNLDNWRRTSEGKKFYRASGIKLGTRYGALYGGDRAFATKHEILLADRLNGWSIPYEWNSKVFKTGRRGGYKIDFYFPQYKVAVEIDGKHHKTARMVLHDTKRDRFLLRKYGVRTVRVRNEDVKSLTKSGLIRRISVITNI